MHDGLDHGQEIRRGLSLLYLAVWRSIHNRGINRISSAHLICFAMGALGSDIAVEAADIVLMSDNLSGIPYLKQFANSTLKTIKASITLSMCINFAAVTLSVLGLLTPTIGALVHNAGSCFVVLIAALLYDRKFD